MSVITSNTIFIDNFPMQIAKVTLTQAGDTITQTFDYRGISKDTSISRHILVNGWLTVDGYLNGEKVATEYTETPYISKLRYGHIISPYGTYDIDTAVTTASEDNSSFYCIFPKTQTKIKNNSVNDLVRDKVWRIPSSQPFHFSTGRYYFSNIDLEINGIIKKAYEPIACVFKEIDVTPSIDAAIAEFWVEKVLISV